MGQPAKSWIWSPFGFNILLSLLRDGTVKTDEFLQINHTITKKRTWVTKNKLYYSPTCRTEDLIQNASNVTLETEKLDFESPAAKNYISKWANQLENFNAFDIGSNFSSDTNFALINITTFQDRWKISDSSGLTVKVINSFNYTLDLKYEARFLEIPMQDEDMKLIIVIPNETDQLCTLFRRLSNEGLSAALASVQPVFTTNFKLVAPDISISSVTDIHLMDDNKPVFNGSSVQYGIAKIDETGAFVRVLTYLSSSKSSNTQSVTESFKEGKLYFFAIILKDTPLITGQYFFISNSTNFLLT